MAKKGIPVEPRQLIDAVQEVIKRDGRPSPFTEGRPGRKWLDLFFKRHPSISLRKPEALGIARGLVTERAIREWHHNLESYIIEETGNNDLLKDPSRILNGDESGFQTNPVTSLVIGPKGFKDLYQVRGSEKECITIMVTFTASGSMVPPCIVYPYERIPAEISRNVNPSWSLGRSKSGWMTSQVFYGYVTNSLLPYLKDKNTTFPVLYIVDGHRSHISFEVASFCIANGIILYSLLPNATHILQPADVSVFRPIKVSWKKLVSDWLSRTGARAVTRANFAPLIENALQAANEDILKNGFKKCGIFPFDRENIDYSKCLSHESRIIDKPCQFNTEHLLFLESMIPSARVRQFRSSKEEWNGDESAKELFHVWYKIKNHISKQATVDVPSSNDARESSDLVTNLNMMTNQNEDNEFQTILQVNSESSLNGNNEDNSSVLTSVEKWPEPENNVTLRVEEPQPSTSAEPESLITPKAARSIKTGVSPAFADCVTWPTQSPVKRDGKCRKKIKLPDAIGAGAWVDYWRKKDEEKILKEQKRKERLEKKQEKEELKKKQTEMRELNKKKDKSNRKKKLSDSSSSEEDEIMMEVEEDSMDGVELADLVQSRTPTPNQEELFKDPEEGNFALVKFPIESGGKEVYYIGQIKKMKENEEIEVTCLRKSQKCTNKFIFPIVPDIAVIEKDQIVYVLKPTVFGGTKRQQSSVSFEINLKNYNIR